MRALAIAPGRRRHDGHQLGCPCSRCSRRLRGHARCGRLPPQLEACRPCAAQHHRLRLPWLRCLRERACGRRVPSLPLWHAVRGHALRDWTAQRPGLCAPLCQDLQQARPPLHGLPTRAHSCPGCGLRRGPLQLRDGARLRRGGRHRFLPELHRRGQRAQGASADPRQSPGALVPPHAPPRLARAPQGNGSRVYTAQVEGDIFKTLTARVDPAIPRENVSFQQVRPRSGCSPRRCRLFRPEPGTRPDRPSLPASPGRRMRAARRPRGVRRGPRRQPPVSPAATACLPAPPQEPGEARRPHGASCAPASPRSRNPVPHPRRPWPQVLVSPYSYLREYTPHERWLGAWRRWAVPARMCSRCVGPHLGVQGARRWTASRSGRVRQCPRLCARTGLRCARPRRPESQAGVVPPIPTPLHWRRVGSRLAAQFVEEDDMPFLIREHARKFQWGCSHLMVWRRV